MEQQDIQQTLTQLVAKESWSLEDHDELLKTLFETVDAPRKFKDLLNKLESTDPEPRGAAALKIGIARYMLCRFDEALKALSAGTDNVERAMFTGLCHLHLRTYGQAVEAFERAKTHGGDTDQFDLRMAEAHALAGEFAEAEKIVKRLEKRCAERAFFHYVRGLARELQGFGSEAADAYEQARTLDPACSEATFRLAYFLDLHGDEDQAIDLYQECITHPPIRANALLNLAVLYDDGGDYDKAVTMARRVLAINPNHARALLILKDAQSSKVMFYDEEQARRMAHRNAILDTPVTDFELSVRARNCLKKMNIRTLGDLVRTTESLLMSYKNFGETSLREIKDMLSAKGLSLGQGLELDLASAGALLEIPVREPGDVDSSDAANLPIGQVEFSVRVRRALDTLDLETLGDLADKTEAELLTCPNFGQTSLNEVHAKLAEQGLKLAED